jgi:hypothetical protein
MDFQGIGTIPPVFQPGTVVTDGETFPLTKEDNTGNLATVTANVVNGQVQNIALPQNYAVIQNGQAGLVVEQANGDPGGPLSATISNNAGVLRLANLTQRVVSNLQSCNINSVVGAYSGFAGLLSVSGGVLNGITLPQDAAIVQGGNPMTLPVTGTYTNTITAQVNANGVLTGFVLS